MWWKKVVEGWRRIWKVVEVWRNLVEKKRKLGGKEKELKKIGKGKENKISQNNHTNNSQQIQEVNRKIRSKI